MFNFFPAGGDAAQGAAREAGTAGAAHEEERLQVRGGHSIGWKINLGTSFFNSCWYLATGLSKAV